mmetsp:Transcript_104581/g.337079  ORF Transcript_104581/g.337079 Transcript_104581/m.337079 type:complete len:243 (-) Transcript_104581:837-1565(-)
MSSWMRALTLPKGSPAILLAKDVSKALFRCAPSVLSKFTTAWVLSSGFEAARCLRVVASNAFCCTCTKAGASSAASASASMACMAGASEATALARRKVMPCCAKRIVAAEVFSATAPLMMPMACVRVDNSAARKLVRWSQVLALSLHIFDNLFVYSLSSSKVDSTVVKRWLADSVSAIVSSFSCLVSSSLWFSALTESVLAWVNISNSARESASILSVETFSARKSSWSFSKSARMPLEWKS